MSLDLNRRHVLLSITPAIVGRIDVPVPRWDLGAFGPFPGIPVTPKLAFDVWQSTTERAMWSMLEQNADRSERDGRWLACSARTPDAAAASHAFTMDPSELEAWPLPETCPDRARRETATDGGMNDA